MKKENGGPAFPAASVPVELSDDLLWKWFKESLKRRGLHDFDFCVLRDVADKAAAYGREQAKTQNTETGENEMSLKPCPCGKVPTELQIVSAYRSKFLMAAPSCCSEWMFEFRSDYLNPAAPECTALAVDAWNKMPRGNNENK